MAESSKGLAVVPTPVAQYVTALVVLDEEGKHISVPVNAEANRFKSQLMAAKLRDFMDKQIKLHSDSGKKLKPMEIKDLIVSAAKVEDVARFAYAPGLTPGEGGETGETAAQIMAKNMAAGMAEGMATAQIKFNSAEERSKKILELGKKPEKKVEPIDPPKKEWEELG